MGGDRVRILLDTHAFLWWLAGDTRLSLPARTAIGDERSEVLVSAASAWEICTKVRIGKLPGAVAIARDLMGCLAEQGFLPLAVSVEHAQDAGNLPGPHRDPFDRMLIAQSFAHHIPLVSNERVFDAYGVERLW